MRTRAFVISLSFFLICTSHVWAMGTSDKPATANAILKSITSGTQAIPISRIRSRAPEAQGGPSAGHSSAQSSTDPSTAASKQRVMLPLPAAASTGRTADSPRFSPVSTNAVERTANRDTGLKLLPTRLQRLLGGADLRSNKPKPARTPRVRAKALFCMDNSCNKVVLAQNVSEPLPIASITKLLTAVTVIDTMNRNRIIRIPKDVRKIPRHRVGLRPGDLLSVDDLLHGMLIESGNDCAEVLARAYPKGGRHAFMALMNRTAQRIGAKSTQVLTPSGLDKRLLVGRKSGRSLVSRRPNVASAEDVAKIASYAFRYPLIRQITQMKRHTIKTRNKKPRTYVLATNDKLLHRKLPVAGAKTGYTNLAGRCIVALFKDELQKRDYTVVVLNTSRHFKAAEKIYKWACKTF